jgi:hypothetical protein
MGIPETIGEYAEKQSYKIRQRARNKAIKNVETTLIYSSRKQEDLTLEEWEHLVHEEEKEIWEKYKKGGLWSLIALAFWMP